MDAMLIECLHCGTKFLAIARPGDVTCPECGITDTFAVDEDDDAFSSEEFE